MRLGEVQAFETVQNGDHIKIWKAVLQSIQEFGRHGDVIACDGEEHQHFLLVGTESRGGEVGEREVIDTGGLQLGEQLRGRLVITGTANGEADDEVGDALEQLADLDAGLPAEIIQRLLLLLVGQR